MSTSTWLDWFMLLESILRPHPWTQGWVAVPLTTLYDVDSLVEWAANHSAVVHAVRVLLDERWKETSHEPRADHEPISR